MINQFDTFDYDEELPTHMTAYYCERKCEKMLLYLESSMIGIDLGCGTGHHIRYLSQNGNSVLGLDSSAAQLRKCQDIITILGDVRKNPMEDNSYNFAYFINVLHHLKDKHDQIQALKEAARIVKHDGLVFVHEINMKNFFFAFYVKYIFGFFRRIDDGDEYWFSPKLFEEVPEFKLINTEHFTFTPDFCPKCMLPAFKRIDQWSDDKWFAEFGAHIMYVLRRQ